MGLFRWLSGKRKKSERLEPIRDTQGWARRREALKVAPASPVSEPAKDNSDFLTSMVVAEVTDNALLGYAVGGSIAGGIVGQSLADSFTAPDPSPSFDSFSSCDSTPSDPGSFGGDGCTY